VWRLSIPRSALTTGKLNLALDASDVKVRMDEIGEGAGGSAETSISFNKRPTPCSESQPSPQRSKQDVPPNESAPDGGEGIRPEVGQANTNIDSAGRICLSKT